MQVVQVHLESFRCNSLLKCGSQKKLTKNPYLGGVQYHLRSSTLTPIKSLSTALVMTRSMSVPICNHFHATQDNCSKTTTF